MQTQISVSGLSEEQASDAIPAILEDLNARTDLRDISVRWDARRERLVVTVARAGDDPAVQGGDGAANYDDVFQSLRACADVPPYALEFYVDSSRLTGLPN